MNHITQNGQRVIKAEAMALVNLSENMPGKFSEVVELVANSNGKIVLTGVGKSGIIAKKICSTLSSLSIPSFYLDPTDAAHGDLGALCNSDLVIAISYSGGSQELSNILPSINKITKLVLITSNTNCKLAEFATILELPKLQEACYMDLAPTVSSTMTLALGDAIAIAAAKQNNVNKTDFATNHPAGGLGKRLSLTVASLMSHRQDLAVANEDTLVKDAIILISEKNLGSCIIMREGQVTGIFTDGDLRRALNKQVDINSVMISELMTKDFKSAAPNELAYNIMKYMKEFKITELPVIENGELLGLISVHKIIEEGIV